MNDERRIDQASAVPYRQNDAGFELCLITSASSRQWVFPKGIIDPGETAEETALKESWEEAGLRGRIVGQPLGVYQYHKWNRDLNVLVLLMHVETVADEWEEAHFRERRWATVEMAGLLIQRDYLLNMLQLANERLQRGN